MKRSCGTGQSQSWLIELRNQWIALLQKLSVNSTSATPVFSDLVNAYSEPHRFYHTLDHIQSVLQWVDRLQPNAHDLPAIQLAVWFHDVVYDTRLQDNEEMSAAYAGQVLSALEIPNSTVERVSHLILATKHHVVEPTDSDAQILLDADLAILGAPPVQYKEYASAIRQEYAWVSEVDYRVGRCRVLEAFLERAQLYFTEFMVEELDEIARSNLQTEIQSLK
ncbi:MAG: hypothetical protein KME13_22100 [Myxacorys californica WJT36-NPBG1]|jgi:predicted metal-dependent HD superfamily phosphohydrolase|nr:hypothetical protein [Myxacorys californica WJT36-NPBG1]